MPETFCELFLKLASGLSIIIWNCLLKQTGFLSEPNNDSPLNAEAAKYWNKDSKYFDDLQFTCILIGGGKEGSLEVDVPHTGNFAFATCKGGGL